jgi:hypothetical protein
MSRLQPDDTAASELKALLNNGREGAATFDAIAKFYTEQFKYSAGQRISTLQYFVPAFAFLTAGYVQLLTAKDSIPIPPFAPVMVATLAFVIALAFARLDRRNKQIVEMDEHPLETIQDAISMRLGGHCRWKSFERRNTEARWLTTYGALIPLIYLVCALAAAAGIIYPFAEMGWGDPIMYIGSATFLVTLLVAIYAPLKKRNPPVT